MAAQGFEPRTRRLKLLVITDSCATGARVSGVQSVLKSTRRCDPAQYFLGTPKALAVQRISMRASASMARASVGQLLDLLEGEVGQLSDFCGGHALGEGFAGQFKIPLASPLVTPLLASLLDDP